MALRRNSRRIKHVCGTLGLAVILSTFFGGCGPRKGAKGPAPYAAYVPDPLISKPPPLSGVPLGSKDVASFPPPGSVKGPVLMHLASEPGAKIFYKFADSEGLTSPASQEYSYGQPLLLVPPVTIFAQAEVGGERGPIRSFSYTEDRALWPALAHLDLERLTVPAQIEPLRTMLSEFTSFAPGQEYADPKSGLVVDIDGKADEWTGQSRLTARDMSFDVPSSAGATDITWAQAHETDDGLYLVMAFRSHPREDVALAYGFDLGASQITGSSFGQGVRFVYRGELKGGVFSLRRRNQDDQPVSLSPQTRATLGDVVEFFIAKEDLNALDGEHELVLRPYAYDGSQATGVFDRTEPIFLRSQFTLTRSHFDLSGRPVALDFLATEAASATPLPELYSALTAQLMPGLEAANQIRMQAAGSWPLFFVDKEETGYAGLNTSDRGVLTTLGSNASLIAQAHLLSHELAHYQNARHSQLTDRWLQEGMSEWSAARLLVRHFPPRATYKFLRDMRFDHYFDSLTNKGESFALADWDRDDASTLGYEKSFMFFALLENKLGSTVLRKAFQKAVNEPMGATAFARFLQQETGEDILSLYYPFWVTAGEPRVGLSPEEYFKDDDGDELLNGDELAIGSDPSRVDSDGDGYFDAEEFYRRTDATKSDVATEIFSGGSVAIVPSMTHELTGILRLATKDGGQVLYSPNPFASAGHEAYQRLLFWRPPFALSARQGSDTVHWLEQDLVIDGVTQHSHWQDYEILPSTSHEARHAEIHGGEEDLGGAKLADHAGDLPDELQAYDVTATEANLSDSQLTVVVSTRAPPSRYGDHGEYFVVFEGVDWSKPSPAVKRFNTLSVMAGTPRWHDHQAGGEAAQAAVDLRFVSSSSALSVTVDRGLVAEWLAFNGEKLVCAYTHVQLPGSAVFKDRAGCLQITADQAFVRRDGFIQGAYGATRHQLGLSIASDSPLLSGMAHLQKLGLSAIKAFEETAGRPLLDRAFWPIHLSSSADASISGSASYRAGAYLKVPSTLPSYQVEYLFVEQLARLVMADLLEREPNQPYWMQEVFIQWLASSAMYKVAKTRDVHDFHWGRLDVLKAYLASLSGGPADHSFAQDIPLAEWDHTTPYSTGSVKSLLLLLRLNTLVGAEVLARSFGSYFNDVPEPVVLKALLEGYASAQASQVDNLWRELVEGSGDPAADRAASLLSLADDDGDRLYRFEEEQLGFDDAIQDAYPP